MHVEQRAARPTAVVRTEDEGALEAEIAYLLV